MSDSRPTGIVARIQALFGDVRPGEGASVVLLAANVFLLLTAYYLLKTVREPLILVGGGAEVKSYAAAGQAVLLLGVVKGFDALSRRYGRMKLIAVTMSFFIGSLLIFVVLGQLAVPIGVPFYLWLGMFNMSAVAQFWSLANDVYTTEQGKRLFAMIGLGASLGGILGAAFARALVVVLSPYLMMLIAAGLLGFCLALAFAVDRRERPTTRTKEPVPIGGETAISMLLRDRYLLTIALLVVLINLVNTNGEYILDRTLVEVTAGKFATDKEMYAYIGAFKAEYFFFANILSALIQAFLVSRLLKYLGLRYLVFFLPVIALGSYAALALAPALAVIRIAKITENSVDYSVQNTTRHALFLPTSRAAKFKVKALIDGFLVRMSDVASAGIVFAGTSLALSTKHFIWINLGVVIAGLGAATMMSRLVRSREQDALREASTPDAAAAS